MNAVALELHPLVPADRVRVINRSVRCFIFGIIGAIPCIGLSMALLAFKLYGEVASETGERVNLVPLHLCTVTLLIAAACTPFELPDVLLLYGILMFGMQILFLRRQYQKNAPLEWNPARHLAYWGIGFANTGILLSAAAVVWAIYLVKQP
ncbi:MAG TPA: hypothetical protein VH619_00660 [Verrucomicrobiae bacterium]|jgi:hypothetical protein|nr:hypothetical protein [Verrucomicrobiae bacterium]